MKELTAWADQLLYNLSLIKLCSACAIKNRSDACSLSANYLIYLENRGGLLVINFEQVTKSFLV